MKKSPLSRTPKIFNSLPVFYATRWRIMFRLCSLRLNLVQATQESAMTSPSVSHDDAVLVFYATDTLAISF